MTPAALRRHLARHHPADWPTDSASLLAAIEQQAEREPGSPFWSDAARAAHWIATAPTGLPDGMHRESLVRADALSATWTAFDTSGDAFLVRVPRPEITPVERRILQRDARVLRGLVGCVLVEEALVAPLPGVPLSDAPPPPGSASRALATAVIQLQRWSASGFFPAPPAPEELRWTAEGTAVVALTPGIRHEAWIRAVVRELEARRESPMAALVDRLRSLPVPELDEVAAAVSDAFAATLSREAVELHRQGLLRGHDDRKGRLMHAIRGLHKAVKPPIGRASVGFDLDGRETFVVSDGMTIRWGHDAEAAVLYERGTFRAPEARRLLRACVAAPTGQAPFTESIGRWVGTGLRLRTLHMLLEKVG